MRSTSRRIIISADGVIVGRGTLSTGGTIECDAHLGPDSIETVVPAKTYDWLDTLEEVAAEVASGLVGVEEWQVSVVYDDPDTRERLVISHPADEDHSERAYDAIEGEILYDRDSVEVDGVEYTWEID